MRLIIAILFTANLALVFSETVRYDDYQLFKVTPNNDGDVQFLENLEKIENYQFWTNIKATGYPVDILIPPNVRKEFEISLKTRNMSYEIVISNVQDLIDAEAKKMETRGPVDWANYHTLDEINEWLQGLTETYPNIVTLITAGTSYEGRSILGVHVSFNPNNKNRSVCLEGNIHAREWISSAVVTYILNELLTSSDPNVRQVAESHDWYVVPVFNPDGFEYTHSNDRLWRKTRVPYEDGCYGADPNRNWGYHWNEGGSDNYACSDIYGGPSAFSEPSTKSISEFLSTIADNLVGYIGFHSYSQLLLIPYGYSYDHLDNYDELREVGLLGLESLASRYGTQYEIGNVPEVIYIASGGSIDWVKGTFKTRITYTYELRDTGRYGFLLPPEQIIPTGEETLDSLVTIFQEFDQRP